MLHLNAGWVGNESLISSANFAGPHTSQFVMDPAPSAAFYPTAILTESTLGYGFGWFQLDYQGHLVQMHNGQVFGFGTNMVVMPTDGLGIFISETGSTSRARQEHVH